MSVTVATFNALRIKPLALEQKPQFMMVSTFPKQETPQFVSVAQYRLHLQSVTKNVVRSSHEETSFWYLRPG